ncbi:DUF2332 domain-containing protein [Qipengyuania sp. JC766]|uniref:DUF2332 domain-containing protein n=1 Tax=Qipengyuania sp. JC766 TaxID=3232139 RepID=UPI0034598EDD
MAIDRDAQYEVIDPQATGTEAVDRAFENQVAYCRDNGAQITADICAALRELLDSERGGAVMRRVRMWAGPPLADALPLRVAGGLHALHLSGDAPELAPLFTGQRVSEAAALLADVMERHEAVLMPWLDGPPQTNEAGRSACYAAALLWLADRGLAGDFALYELGSSAGVNLMMRRYRYDLGGTTTGPATARMQIAPDWRGDPPPQADIDIVAARGCDIKPVDLTDEDAALRLRAYIWPEQTERFARLDAAIAAARTFPPEVERQAADAFVAAMAQNEGPGAGTTRVLMHSVVWQYLPQEQRERIEATMEELGAAASEDAPLAWISLEANRDLHRHELRVRYWPGGEEWHTLATAHPHGAWIEWTG